ncbi:hypothetical protein J1N35_023605 [Gossypium stocksii]|uniref:Uncharacterized protein n=1 Tax=Gossypium stocksii TaxID=47602 RepID=A0A9D4A4J8_9ROSI|nr:hypothetical protein J1N35_023605 [Gossypium stocksii]
MVILRSPTCELLGFMQVGTTSSNWLIRADTMSSPDCRFTECFVRIHLMGPGRVQPRFYLNPKTHALNIFVTRINRSFSSRDMSRMREAHGQLVLHCLLRKHTSKVLVEANYVTYTTKYKEMNRALCARGIVVCNFTYEFFILEGSHRLNDTSDGKFLLPLHALEVGFHLSLYPFFCHLLKQYQIGFSWWTIMTYFIDHCHRNKVPQLMVF